MIRSGSEPPVASADCQSELDRGLVGASAGEKLAEEPENVRGSVRGPDGSARPARSGGVTSELRRPATSAAAKFARATTARPVQPAAAARPAADVGRVEELLAEPARSTRPAASVLGGGSKRSRARTVPTTNPTGSETRACRFFAEKKSSDRRIVSTARPTCRPSRTQAVGELAPGRVVGHAFAQERRAEPPGQPVGRRGLRQEVVGERVGVEPGGLAEDGLLAVVVVLGSYLKPALHDRPARQRPRGVLDVVFGVIGRRRA